MGCASGKTQKGKPDINLDHFRSDKIENQQQPYFCSENVLIQKKSQSQSPLKRKKNNNNNNNNQDLTLKKHNSQQSSSNLHQSQNLKGTNQQQIYSDNKLLVRVKNEEHSNFHPYSSDKNKQSEIFLEYQAHMREKQKLGKKAISLPPQGVKRISRTSLKDGSDTPNIKGRQSRGLSGNLFRKYGNNNNTSNASFQLQQQQQNQSQQQDLSLEKSKIQILINQNDVTKDCTTSVQDDDDNHQHFQHREIQEQKINFLPSRSYFSEEQIRSSPIIHSEQFLMTQQQKKKFKQRTSILTNHNNIQQQQQQNQSSQQQQPQQSQQNQKKYIQYQMKPQNKLIKKKNELNINEVLQPQKKQVHYKEDLKPSSQQQQQQQLKPELRPDDRKQTLDLRIHEDDFGYVNRKRQNSNNVSINYGNSHTSAGMRQRINSNSSSNFNNLSSIQSPYIVPSAFSEQINF